MFNPNELEAIPLPFEQHYIDLEERIMRDIVRRIKINAEITRSADWQIYRLKEIGVLQSDIEKYIKNAFNLSEKQLKYLYEDIIEKGYARDERIYNSGQNSIIPFKENIELQQLIKAVSEQTKDELKNITQSLGFAVKENGKIVFKPIAAYYQKTLDGAIFDITSGAFDYNTVLKRIVSEMTTSGLRSVDYATGWSNRTPVAARRAVMIGFAQVTNKIIEQEMSTLGTEYVEVSFHVGARPSHQAWQGKVFKWNK